MGLMPEVEASLYEDSPKEKRKAEQRENNEQLVEMLAKKFQTPPPHQCDDPRVPVLERRVAELERMVAVLSSQSHDTYRSGSGIVEPDSPIHAGQEAEPVRGLILKDWEWKGETINLRIEAIRDKTRNNVWYKVTGGEVNEYTGLSEYLFAPYNMDRQRPEESVALKDGSEHEECVQLLYNAGIITGEKTGSYTPSALDPFSSSCTYYRLTDQAIEHANRRQKTTPIQGTVDNAQAEQEEEYPGLRLKNHEWRGREINLYIEAKQPFPDENPWYKITGYYTWGGEEVQFSHCTFDFFRYRDSAAIDMWEDHDKIVRLLYNAGVITKEKTYKSIGLERKCICYRLTDQALAYAHRDW